MSLRADQPPNRSEIGGGKKRLKPARGAKRRQSSRNNGRENETWTSRVESSRVEAGATGERRIREGEWNRGWKEVGRRGEGLVEERSRCGGDSTVVFYLLKTSSELGAGRIPQLES